MNNLDNMTVELGAQLGILAAKNTASTIYNKISVLKLKKADEKTDSILKNGGCSLIIYQMKK